MLTYITLFDVSNCKCQTQLCKRLKMENDRVLEYAAFSSCLNPSFWTKFTSIKLETDKLSEEGRKIYGSYSNLNIFPKITLEVDSTSFNS